MNDDADLDPILDSDLGIDTTNPRGAIEPATLERIRRVCTPMQADVLIAVLQDVSIREIARTTGKNRRTIRDHYHAAIDRLSKDADS